MTAGMLYIFDYLTNAADLDDQELNGKTAGSDYCYIPCEAFAGRGDQSGELIYYPTGKGFFFRYDQDECQTIAGADHLSKVEFGYIKQYWKKHRDNGSDPDYLVYYRTANDFYPYYDEDGNAKDYCRGWFKQIMDEGVDHLEYHIKLLFKEVWD